MEALLRDPSQLRALRDDPDLVDQRHRRGHPVDVAGAPLPPLRRPATPRSAACPIPEGGRVLLSYPSANRDEDVFADSMRFDVRRPDADKLLSFGVGAHFCLGAQFARREIRTMLGKLSQQLAHIEPAGDAEWAEAHFVSGVKHLPVSYAFR